MDKSQRNFKIEEIGGLSYAFTSTAMVMILLQIGLGNVNYEITGDSIMSLFLPTIILLAGIWVPTLKVRRFVKQQNDSDESDL